MDTANVKNWRWHNDGAIRPVVAHLVIQLILKRL